MHLPDDLAARLVAEACRRGQDVDEVAAELLDHQLPTTTQDMRVPRRLSFAGVGASGSSRGGAAADDLLAEGFGKD